VKKGAGSTKRSDIRRSDYEKKAIGKVGEPGYADGGKLRQIKFERSGFPRKRMRKGHLLHKKGSDVWRRLSPLEDWANLFGEVMGVKKGTNGHSK